MTDRQKQTIQTTWENYVDARDLLGANAERRADSLAPLVRERIKKCQNIGERYSIPEWQNLGNIDCWSWEELFCLKYPGSVLN